MFTFKNNAIAHIPKCGGHALALMLSKIGIKYDSSFKIEKGKIVDSTKKHQAFSEYIFPLNTSYYCLIRRLDDWWKSFMWHQSKHVELNFKGNMQKIVDKSYSPQMKEKEGKLLLPKYTAYSIYPDHLLSHILGEVRPKFLRMEYLREDFYKYFDVDLPEVSRESSYSPPERYWNEETRDILYKNNPKWAEIEEVIYPPRMETEESQQVQL